MYYCANTLSNTVLYSELGHEAPFIASMILSAIDFVMRLVIIERSSSPAAWFEDDNDIEKNKDTDSSCDLPIKDNEKKNDSTIKHHVTWIQLLKQPRLIVSLVLTTIVATVMSAFEVIYYPYHHITKSLNYLILFIAHFIDKTSTRMGLQCSWLQSHRLGLYGSLYCCKCHLWQAM
jgi:hypothetical protein